MCSSDVIIKSLGEGGAIQFWLLGENLTHAKWKGFGFNYHPRTNSPCGQSSATQRHQRPLLCLGKFYEPKTKQKTTASILVWEECPRKLPSSSSQRNMSLQQDGRLGIPVWFPHEAAILRVWQWGKGRSQSARLPLGPQTLFQNGYSFGLVGVSLWGSWNQWGSVCLRTLKSWQLGTNWFVWCLCFKG